PLVAARWPGYRVEFPRLERRIDAPYAMVTSRTLAEAIDEAFARRPDCALWCGAEAGEVGERHVRLSDGRRLEAAWVVDARGPAGPVPRAGYQSFLGLEVELDGPHGVATPLLMDATASPQADGFRF